jgi:hypothetical protein
VREPDARAQAQEGVEVVEAIGEAQHGETPFDGPGP